MDYERNLITLNLEIFLASTFIHEELHWRHPSFHEDRIREMEKKAIKRMSVKNIKKLARKVFKRAMKGNLELEEV